MAKNSELAALDEPTNRPARLHRLNLAPAYVARRAGTALAR
jgi:hypothetical protein